MDLVAIDVTRAPCEGTDRTRDDRERIVLNMLTMIFCV